MMRSQMLLIRVALAACLAVPLFAQGKGRAKHSEPGIFTEADRRAVRDWARAAAPGALPPGLAQRGQLPPGMQKKLARGGTLPPGIAKKFSPFPPDLSGRLSPLPPGCACDRVFLDGRALVVARATQAILDVIDVF